MYFLTYQLGVNQSLNIFLPKCLKPKQVGPDPSQTKLSLSYILINLMKLQYPGP